MDYDALENRLKELREDDHERGCEGRFYSCSCDYEPRIDQALKDSQVAIADLRARNDALVKAGQSVIAHMFSTYTARNGRQVGIEADDGEKCWIVHSDHITHLETALAANREK